MRSSRCIVLFASSLLVQTITGLAPMKSPLLLVAKTAAASSSTKLFYISDSNIESAITANATFASLRPS